MRNEKSTETVKSRLKGAIKNAHIDFKYKVYIKINSKLLHLLDSKCRLNRCCCLLSALM